MYLGPNEKLDVGMDVVGKVGCGGKVGERPFFDSSWLYTLLELVPEQRSNFVEQEELERAYRNVGGLDTDPAKVIVILRNRISWLNIKYTK